MLLLLDVVAKLLLGVTKLLLGVSRRLLLVTDVGMVLVTVARISRLESFVPSEQLLAIDDRLSELLLLLLLTIGKISRLLLLLSSL